MGLLLLLLAVGWVLSPVLGRISAQNLCPTPGREPRKARQRARQGKRKGPKRTWEPERKKESLKASTQVHSHTTTHTTQHNATQRHNHTHTQQMVRVRIHEPDALFVLRHAQRCDKVATTVSSIEFDYTAHSNHLDEPYNPRLASFATTQSKNNNGVVQSRALAAKVLTYVTEHVQGDVVLRFHSSPYVRCLETIKYMLDYLVKEELPKKLTVVVEVDHVLSEWLNSELDVNYYPPNDNGVSLMNTATQYLHSNLPFNRNDNVHISLQLNDPYKHGKPGPFSESFLHQYTRLSRGLSSIVKETTLSLTPSAKDIILVMTHGACVRSLISKIIGKSLYVEIPLASATLVKPEEQRDSSHYFWKMVETDIELRCSQDFKPVDIFSHRDPFQDIHTTFNSGEQKSQLDFKNGVPPSKMENVNRMRSQSLLTPRIPHHHNSDSESDSDDEGLSFNVHPGRRRALTPLADSQHSTRFRSSSLFGQTQRSPFLENTPSSRKNSFERTKKLLMDEQEAMTSSRPNSHAGGGLTRSGRSSNNGSSTNLVGMITPQVSYPDLTNFITPVHSMTRLATWQNVDIDDGKQHNNAVPELEEQLLSSSSSTNSLHDDQSSVDELQMSNTAPQIAANLDTAKSRAAEGTTSAISTVSSDTTLKEKSPPLFDKELIEQSLSEYHQLQSQGPDQEHHDTPGWMNFRNDGSAPTKFVSHEQQQQQQQQQTLDDYGNFNRFKIDLYGKKNRNNKLSLYDSDEEEENRVGGGGWFLGSNH